eukprot:6292558-Prorocentrum_lima.AAC.1
MLGHIFLPAGPGHLHREQPQPEHQHQGMEIGPAYVPRPEAGPHWHPHDDRHAFQTEQRIRQREACSKDTKQ